MQRSELVIMRTGLGLAALLSLAACSSTDPATANPKGVSYSFVVIGCNRVDTADTNSVTNPSTANLAQLNRTFSEIAALKPNLLFFAGDLVFGYTNDTTQLASQLQAWRAVYESSPLPGAGVELVAVPGNHEVQNVAKVARPELERTWLRIMAPYIGRGGNGPGVGGLDSLQTDQSRLTYSFDYKDAHFIALNTDPVGADWTVPVQWVKQDALNTYIKGTQKHIFAISHKPAYSYPKVATDGLSKIFPAKRDSLWAALTAARAHALLSSHNHVWWANQPVANGPWQFIAGNGGSKLEAALDLTVPRTGNYYGFTLVQVLNDGTVVVKSYGRDLPAPYNAGTIPAVASTVRDSTTI